MKQRKVSLEELIISHKITFLSDCKCISPPRAGDQIVCQAVIDKFLLVELDKS